MKKGGGYVYVFSSDNLPGVVKIGFTRKPPHARLRQFNSTLNVLKESGPVFKLEFYVEAANPEKVEDTLHSIFLMKRLWRDREFFNADPIEVAAVAEKVARSRVIWADTMSEVTEEPSDEDDSPGEWPWGERKRMRVKGGRSRGKFQGGGAVYVWLYKQQPALDALDDIDWPMVAFSYGRHQQAMGKKFNPPSPKLFEVVWDRVQQWVFENGWDERRFGANGSGSEHASSGTITGGDPFQQGSQVSVFPVDAGPLRDSEGDLR